MRFCSSRNRQKVVSLSQAITQGLAPDGGLYVPQQLPRLQGGPASNHLADVASWALRPFFQDDPLSQRLDEIARTALDFPAKLVPLSGATEEVQVLELFHGPTAAFKDFGARFLAACLQHQRATASKPTVKPLTILVATSGDTGGAVAAAFHRKPWADVHVLFPKGQVSPRQQQQLTCWDENVHSYAVRGGFDSCQKMVKAAFGDTELAVDRDLSSANSINIGRLLPQLVYYAAASLDLRRQTGQSASFIVPSGNLGNVMACVWAREMGLPIGEIVLAHNANRVVPDYLSSGHWQPRASQPTLACAMDVGDPSNMERLRTLFPAVEDLRQRISAYSVSDEEIRRRISADYAAYQRVWCPHSATAAEVYARLPEARRKCGSWVLTATAHPAKFSEIVEPLIGRAVEVPDSLQALLSLPSIYREIEPELDALKTVLKKNGK